MKNKLFILASCLFLISSLTVSAQKLVNVSGDILKLKGEKKILVQYDFTNFSVGDYKNEQDYINKRKAEILKKEGEAEAKKWEDAWHNAKEARFMPKFESVFNETSDGIVINRDFKDAKYTLIVKTTFIEPGFNVGVMKKPAYINVEYIFVETANPSNIIAKYTCNNIPGAQAMGYDFDASTRISESYAKAGKNMGKFMAKTFAK